jgi:hypothetical protein
LVARSNLCSYSAAMAARTNLAHSYFADAQLPWLHTAAWVEHSCLGCTQLPLACTSSGASRGCAHQPRPRAGVYAHLQDRCEQRQ